MSEEAIPQSLPPLVEYAETIHQNFSQLMLNRQLVAEAAEAIHGGFQMLLGQTIEVDSTDIPMGTAAPMALTAHYAWIYAFVLTGAGNDDIGLGMARRAIEFCCYAAKVAENADRAKDWMNQQSDPAARNRFRGACQFPTAYENEKYRFLWPLIVNYDMASDAAIHANLMSLAGKWEGVREGRLYLRHQTEREETVFNAVHTCLIGHRLYRALAQILDPLIKDRTAQRQMQSYVTDQVKKLRVGYANFKYEGKTPSHVLKAIIEEDDSVMEQRFLELLGQAKQARKTKPCPKCGTETPPRPAYSCPECKHEF